MQARDDEFSIAIVAAPRFAANHANEALTNAMPSIPIWSVALVLAIVSPVAVRLYAEHLQRAARRRTEALLATLPKARSSESASVEKTGTKDAPNVNDDVRQHASVGGEGRSAPH
jgi:hypothetical protein